MLRLARVNRRSSLALAACVVVATSWTSGIVAAALSAAGLTQQDSAPAVVALGVVSTPAPEFSVAFMPDGLTAYFDRAKDDRSHSALLAARRSTAGWMPAPAPSFAGPFSDVDPFITADGRHMYFASNRPDEGRRLVATSTCGSPRGPTPRGGGRAASVRP